MVTTTHIALARRVADLHITRFSNATNVRTQRISYISLTSPVIFHNHMKRKTKT